MKVEIKNFDNQMVCDFEFFEVVFGYLYKEYLIYFVVVVVCVVVCVGIYLIKCCSEVQGLGCKFVCQKGIGCVCMGSICLLIWCKGGMVYGLKLCNYEKNFMLCEKCNVFKLVLLCKFVDEQIVVFDSLQFELYKIQVLDCQFSGFGVFGKVLLVDDFNNDKLVFVVCNNLCFKVVDVMGVNVYDVVGQEYIVFSEEVFGCFVEVFSK